MMTSDRLSISAVVYVLWSGLAIKLVVHASFLLDISAIKKVLLDISAIKKVLLPLLKSVCLPKKF